MQAPAATALAPVFLWLVVLVVDMWVYADAKAQRERGTPVAFSIGTFHIETPGAWFFCCLVLWLVFLPLYFISRGQAA